MKMEENVIMTKSRHYTKANHFIFISVPLKHLLMTFFGLLHNRMIDLVWAGTA